MLRSGGHAEVGGSNGRRGARTPPPSGPRGRAHRRAAAGRGRRRRTRAGGARQPPARAQEARPAGPRRPGASPTTRTKQNLLFCLSPGHQAGAGSGDAGLNKTQILFVFVRHPRAELQRGVLRGRSGGLENRTGGGPLFHLIQYPRISHK